MSKPPALVCSSCRRRRASSTPPESLLAESVEDGAQLRASSRPRAPRTTSAMRPRSRCPFLSRRIRRCRDDGGDRDWTRAAAGRAVARAPTLVACDNGGRRFFVHPPAALAPDGPASAKRLRRRGAADADHPGHAASRRGALVSRRCPSCAARPVLVGRALRRLPLSDEKPWVSSEPSREHDVARSGSAQRRYWVGSRSVAGSPRAHANAAQ